MTITKWQNRTEQNNFYFKHVDTNNDVYIIRHTWWRQNTSKNSICRFEV